MVDAETVRRRLRKLDELVRRLRELGDMSRDDFLGDPRARAAAERFLQVAIQLCLEVGAHVLSDRGVVDWEEYREVPARLADEGVLSRELADRLARAAGQRNVLVHLYLEVDPELVHDTLVHDLDAFVAFAERIDRMLDEESDGDGG